MTSQNGRGMSLLVQLRVKNRIKNSISLKLLQNPFNKPKKPINGNQNFLKAKLFIFNYLIVLYKLL